MQRLIIVHNPRSSKHARIEQEVLLPATKLRGYTIGKFEVKSVSVDENAANLAKVLLDGDLVVAAGGDGTGSVALNGACLSKKDVTLAILGYGNFNDFARTLGYKSFDEIITDYENNHKISTLYPLEALVDGQHFRYAACYFTIGMFAESTEIFDKKDTRKSLRTGKKGLIFSILTLAKWYFANKKRQFLPANLDINSKLHNNSYSRQKATSSSTSSSSTVPEDELGPDNIATKSRKSKKALSDIMFVNGKTVAKMMRGGHWWSNPAEYCISTGRLTSFFRLCWFMLRSILHRVPGAIVSRPTKINFPTPSEIEIQAEGEYRRIKLSSLTIQKSNQGIKVLAK